MTPLPDTGTSLTIESAAIQAPNCSATPKTALRISKVTNFQALEFQLQFNPRIVQVVDANPNKAGVQIAPGNIFNSQQNFIAVNEVDQNAGFIDFAGVIISPQGFSGAGALVEITWTNAGSGISQLTLSQVKVAGAGGGGGPGFSGGEKPPRGAAAGRILKTKIPSGRQANGVHPFLKIFHFRGPQGTVPFFRFQRGRVRNDPYI
jgi:hypothetical protein